MTESALTEYQVDWRSIADKVNLPPNRWIGFLELHSCLHDLETLMRAGESTRICFAQCISIALGIMRDLKNEQWNWRSRFHCASPRFADPGLSLMPIRARLTSAAHRSLSHEDLQKNQRHALEDMELVLVGLADLRQNVLRLPGTIADDIRELREYENAAL